MIMWPIPAPLLGYLVIQGVRELERWYQNRDNDSKN